MRAVLARFGGECGICAGDIVAEEHKVVLVDGEWCHDTCAEEEGYDVEHEEG